jgi:ketosteroid isomerase-like protein
MALSVEDRLDIHELYARFAMAVDAGDADGWVAVFVPDGVWRRHGKADIVGSEQLRQFALDVNAATPGMLHYTTNILLEETPGGALGRAYLLVLRGGDTLHVRGVGQYEDQLVKFNGRWRFAMREYRTSIPYEIADSAFLLEAPAT